MQMQPSTRSRWESEVEPTQRANEDDAPLARGKTCVLMHVPPERKIGMLSRCHIGCCHWATRGGALPQTRPELLTWPSQAVCWRGYPCTGGFLRSWLHPSKIHSTQILCAA